MLCGYPPFYGDCWRQNCGWDQGLPCQDCQESLFTRIQTGQFDFPEEEWGRISSGAIDLIRHLLVKDARLRYSIDDLLRHPWLHQAPKTPLLTPEMLMRNDSIRDFQQMQEHFNAITRLVSQRLSAQQEELFTNTGRQFLLSRVSSRKKIGLPEEPPDRQLTPSSSIRSIRSSCQASANRGSKERQKTAKEGVVVKG
jgi:serine/threonine protein kinase